MYRVQVGKFQSEYSAKLLGWKMRRRGIENFVRNDDLDEDLWRVQVGASEELDEATEIRDMVSYFQFDPVIEDTPFPAAAFEDELGTDQVGTDALPSNTWYGVGPKWGYKPHTTTSYLKYLWQGRYPYGCKNSRHHGLDIGKTVGMPIYTWGRCKITLNRYDLYGYHRYVQVYFPSVNMSLTLGHLRNGSTYPVGTWFKKGQYIAKVGTKREGINHPHVHYRAARGNWGRTPIPPCSDLNPAQIWNALNR